MRRILWSVKVRVKLLSRVRFFVTPWTLAWQALTSMGFSRQEYWSGLPCPPPGDLPYSGIKPRSPALRAESLPTEPPGKPKDPEAAQLFPLLFWRCELSPRPTPSCRGGCRCVVRGLIKTQGALLTQADLGLLRFALLCFQDSFTNWRFVATLLRACLWVVFFQQNLLTSWLCVMFW